MISLKGEGRGEGERAGRKFAPSAPAWAADFNWPANNSTVTVEDILAGRAPRPRVLDMFAGGGAIPLEALRLGCEAYALDLNPVAHIVELCTLVYPQKFGKPDPEARGMTGPKNAQGETTWGGLAEEVRYWGNWVLDKVHAEIGDLYPLIFANGTHVELDGQHALASGSGALVEKKKSKYRLRDFLERGDDGDLGLPTDEGQSAPLVDTLHRILWLMEKRPTELPAYLRDAQPNREQLRLVAQALAGPALKGGELGDVSPTAELSALGKLTANWQSVIEDAALTTGEKEEKKIGQKQLI